MNLQKREALDPGSICRMGEAADAQGVHWRGDAEVGVPGDPNGRKEMKHYLFLQDHL